MVIDCNILDPTTPSNQTIWNTDVYNHRNVSQSMGLLLMIVIVVIAYAHIYWMLLPYVRDGTTEAYKNGFSDYGQAFVSTFFFLVSNFLWVSSIMIIY